MSDPSALGRLDTLADRGAAVPLLLVLTARPEFRLPWTPGAHHTTMALGRLPPEDARTLVERTAEGLARELVDVVVERTDGIPLFVEELTRLVAERVGALDPRRFLHPERLAHGAPRRARRARDRTVGAVVGRQFTYRHLRASWPARGRAPALLDRLRQSDLVQVQGDRPDATHRWHALVQALAYASPFAHAGATCTARSQPLSPRNPTRHPKCWRGITTKPAISTRPSPRGSRPANGRRARRAR